MKLFLTILSALALANAEQGEECNCSETEHSRASLVTGATTQKQFSFTVIGMSCTSCEEDLTKKLEKVEEITSVEKVSSAEKVVTVSVSSGTSETVIKEAITKAGYYVPPKEKKGEVLK